LRVSWGPPVAAATAGSPREHDLDGRSRPSEPDAFGDRGNESVRCQGSRGAAGPSFDPPSTAVGDNGWCRRSARAGGVPRRSLVVPLPSVESRSAVANAPRVGRFGHARSPPVGSGSRCARGGWVGSLGPPRSVVIVRSDQPVIGRRGRSFGAGVRGRGWVTAVRVGCTRRLWARRRCPAVEAP